MIAKEGTHRTWTLDPAGSFACGPDTGCILREEAISEQVTQSLLLEEMRNERFILWGRIVILVAILTVLAVARLAVASFDEMMSIRVFTVSILCLSYLIFTPFFLRCYTVGHYRPRLKYVLTILDLLVITGIMAMIRGTTGTSTFIMSTDSAPLFALFLVNALSGMRLDMKLTHLCAGASVAIFAGFSAFDFTHVVGLDETLIISAVIKGILLAGTAYASGFIGYRSKQLIVDNLREHETRSMITSTLGTYLSGPATDRIMVGNMKLGGEERNVTILFSDIRDFTWLSEKLSAQEMVSLLNDYFDRMVQIVFKYDGIVDKFLGDGMMAIFGAPFSHEDDPERAVRAALEMRRMLKEFNRDRIKKEPMVTISMGIGISTGMAVVGTIGSAARMEYTAIGDTVNTASRIKDIGREYDTDIVTDEGTYQKVRNIVAAEHLGPAKLKGKDALVDLYKISGGDS